ncbi:MAG: NAD(+) synthase [Coriobacteriia bacterium]|nr:NAD(+) synthase [Coriobacteriia bacterium]
MYIALVQNNPKVGALSSNAEKMLQVIEELSYEAYPPDLVVFPAYAMSGMPLDGLAFSAAFNAECLDVARDFISQAKLPCLFGSVVPLELAWRGHVAEADIIYCQSGLGGTLGFSEIEGPRFSRRFVQRSHYMEVKINDAHVAIFLDSFPDYEEDFTDCDLLIVMMAKEYVGADGMLGSSDILSDLRSIASDSAAWMVVCNLVGGQDDVVFDGGSLIIDPTGTVVEAAQVFETGIIKANLTFSSAPARSQRLAVRSEAPSEATSEAKAQDKASKPLLPYEADWRALGLATRDYAVKNGFSDVVIGLSGGIDSALTAVLAVDAFGNDYVHGVLLPSEYTSEESTNDAIELGQSLGIDLLTMPITDAIQAVLNQSMRTIGHGGSETAQQNMQARMRMLYLMHLSNTFGWMLLNTSNKSEGATGFSTLYGDTAGAYAPFGNVYKTDIYGMANWRNSRQAVIPQAILEKAPTAELYAGQLDTDSLPPYEVLDRILRLHIEDRMGLDQILDIVANTPGGDPIEEELVADVLKRVARAEFKRRVEPIAPNIGSMDMNNRRSWPVTNGFVDRNRNIKSSFQISDLINTLRDWQRPEDWGYLAN